MRVIYGLILLFIIFGCQNNRQTTQNDPYKHKKKPAPKIQPLRDPSLKHLFVEKPAPGDTSEERYNKDNIVFKVGRSFYYNAIYKDKKGTELWAKVNDYTHFDKWDTIATTSPGNNAITGFRAVVQPGRKPFSDLDNRFNRSVLAYEYLMPNGVFDKVALTQLIENKKNVWMLPPRNFLFKVLELSPYPYVKFPLDSVNKWYYQRTISDKWGDDHWMHWKGRRNAKFTYYNKGRRLANHPSLGEIPVYVIKGIGAFQDLTSQIEMYYSEKYGFVQLNYLNVDSSTVSIVLTKAEK